MCVCPRPSGKRNKLRVYYLSWLRNKILHNDPEVEKKQGWTTVGDMEGCGHYRVGEEDTTEWPEQHLFMEREKWELGLTGPEARDLGPGIGGVMRNLWEGLAAQGGRSQHPSSFLPPVKYERIKFLVIALKNSVEVYAWAPKPYHKFMAFKVIPASAPQPCSKV